MNKRQFAQTAKGPTAELVFVIGARNEFHSAAYREKPTLAQLMDSEQHGNLIVSANEMNALISNILVKLKVPSLDLDRLSPLLGRETVSLGDLLHETFRNTAEHAYLDLDDRIPKEGLRCILIAIRNMQPGQIQANAIVSAEHQHLSRYVRRLSRRASVARRSLVCLFELSVFDTGPGFAGTMELQSDASDIDRVAHCFRDYVSKKPGPNSGLGLGRVLKSVHSLDGYLRVRTSTAEVFFSAATPMPSDTGPVPSVVGGLPKVVGTAITIGIPLEL
ncbi:MAG: hypothetical protein OXH60_02835 [Rhodospirillales bacterium]|nr:hypothetical protein [Rhodospirillales bacterium]